MGSQHDGHLSFWLPAINPLFISLSLHVLLAVGEIHIHRHHAVSDWNGLSQLGATSLSEHVRSGGLRRFSESGAFHNHDRS